MISVQDNSVNNQGRLLQSLHTHNPFNPGWSAERRGGREEKKREEGQGGAKRKEKEGKRRGGPEGRGGVGRGDKRGQFQCRIVNTKSWEKLISAYYMHNLKYYGDLH